MIFLPNTFPKTSNICKICFETYLKILAWLKKPTDVWVSSQYDY